MFIVLEIQKTSETEVANLVSTHTNRNEAESKFHQVLSAAAISNIPKHSAVLLTDDGVCIKRESFVHEEYPNSEETEENDEISD